MKTSGTSALKPDQKYSYADYRSWPEAERWELIRGVPFAMSPAPRRVHQWLVSALNGQLYAWFRGKPCRPYVSPIDVFLPDAADQDLDDIDTVVQPDLLVVCDPAKLIDEGIRGAPDFVIEILSPSTAWRDQTEKLQLYQRHRVREFWLANPETLDVFIYVYGQDGFQPPRAANLRQTVPVSIFPGLDLQIETPL
jgi:Uma2 family endonuclease